MNTEIIVITDRSGSMTIIREDANGGFAAFIDEQKKVKGEARVTQVMFDDRIETPYEAKPLADVPPLNLEPRGMTALYDAIGQALNTQGKRIHDENWAELVIVVIITDGMENASKEYSCERVAEMIRHAEKNGWKFVFLAANQDAFATGASLNINPQFTQNYAANAVGTRMVYADASATVASLRAGTETTTL